MLNTIKLLYILPDLAYVAELLPTKKPHDFSIQSFRQINGEFINEEQFVANNVIKLFSKLEEGEYCLILPDSLFTNTIVSVQETDDNKIATYLQNELLPQTGISTNTHDLDTTILTTFKNQAKVQISALEKSLLAPIRVGVEQTKIKIISVSPLSWTVKSLVSLEPSITVLQIGGLLYSALHYIGVDQTNQSSTQDTEKIIETIKTLKGAEANVQTLYLLTDQLVENRFKESLGAVLPAQQLASSTVGSDQLSGYVKQIIETSAKTLSIEEYPVPKFKLSKALPEDHELIKQVAEEKKEDEQEEIPKPTTKEEAPATQNTVSDIIASKPKKLELRPAPVQKPVIIPPTTQPPTVDITSSMEKIMTETSQTPVIQNQSSTKGLLKMLLVTLSVFVAVVAVGVGVGLGLLSLSNNRTTPVESPKVETAPTEVPTPTPTQSPEQTKVDLSTTKLLVVNATTQAGYAGKIKTLLEKAGAKSVTAGNSKGSYKSQADGLVLMTEENAELVVTLSEATGLKLEYAKEELKTEDPNQSYTAVIVLLK